MTFSQRLGIFHTVVLQELDLGLSEGSSGKPKLGLPGLLRSLFDKPNFTQSIII